MISKHRPLKHVFFISDDGAIGCLLNCFQRVLLIKVNAKQLVDKM
jgi:hypothetical protein